MRAAIYVRVSTTNQEEEGTSLASQERFCRAYAESHDWEVVRVFQDAYTGSLWRERPGLTELRELVKVGAIDVVLCYALDRLSRNQTHVAVIIDDLEHHGAYLEIVTEDFENSATGKFIRSARSFAAELEREKIVERQVRGKRERALSGKLYRSGVDLFGYRRIDEGDIITREIVETEAMVVRQIYDWMATEGLSTRSIVRRLNEQGIRPPSVIREIDYGDDERTPRWGKTQVRRILTNPAYKGETYAWRYQSSGNGKRSGVDRPREDWIRLPDGITPAIVNPAVWQRAQERLHANTGDAQRNEIRQYLLRGMIYCARCGDRMWSDNERGVRMYRCSSRQKSAGACGASRVRADDIEADIWEQAVCLITKPAEIESAMERQRAASPVAIETARRSALERSLERLEHRKAKLTRQFQRSEDESMWALIMADLKRIDQERLTILSTIAELDREVVIQEASRKRLDDFALYCARGPQH